MKLRYKLVDKNSALIFSSLSPEETAITDKIAEKSTILSSSKGRLRCGMINTNSGTVIAVSESIDYINSSKKFIAYMTTLLDALESFEAMSSSYREKVNINTSRLIHNLTSLNAHNIQEVYSIIPQETLSKSTASQQLTVVEKIIKNDPKETAMAMLRLAKNNAAMKTEFSVFKKLFDPIPSLEKKSHNVHKVLMNILYLFFPDFTDKQVNIHITCPDNVTAFFDYESIHVAFYHLIENAVKYVLPNSKVSIDINPTYDNWVIIEISMTSLVIEKDEVEKIFQEGYSGTVAIQTIKSGSGIGMSRVKDILKLNGAKISVVPNFASKKLYIGIPYQENVFKIHLNKRKTTA